MTLQKPERRKMENSIHPLESGIQYVGLKNITASFEDFDPWIPEGIRQILHPPANEVVVDHHFGHVLFQQLVNCMGSYQAATTDDNEAFVFNIHDHSF